MHSITAPLVERLPLPGDALPADAVATIEELRAGRRQRLLSEARDLELAAHYADLFCEANTGRLVPGCERVRQIAGDGTPWVAEFASLELAAALGMRDAEAAALMAWALDLRHRLPWVWSQTMAGEIPAWRARTLAGLVREVDLDAALLIDKELSRSLPGMAWSRVERMVEGLVLSHLEPELAEQRRREALDDRGVWIGQQDFGTAEVQATIDAPQAAVLEETISALAWVLNRSGHGGGLDACRAAALGLLGSPARALQVLQADAQDQLPDEPEALAEMCGHAGEPGHLCGTITVDPAELQPRAQLVVHLTDESLFTGGGVARPSFGSGSATRIRPLLTEWLGQLLPGMTVTVRPVLDANRLAPSDSYEVPRTMRECLEIRNPYEPFPWSTRRSAGLDLDHTIAWDDDGPPGQTRPDNLGPLSRKVHRAKTHSGWRLVQPLPGIFLWQSPLGYRYLVTPSRTIELGRPDRPAPVPTLAAA